MSQSFESMIARRYAFSRGARSFISFISLISMVGIAIGVAVLIVVLSVMNGFESELRARIMSVAAQANIAGLDGQLKDWQLARDIALGHEEVEAASPFIEGNGMFVNGERLSGSLLRGVLPELEGDVAGLEELMIRGSLADLEEGEYRVLLGSSLAEALDVDVGDRVLLMISKANVTPAGVIPRMRRFRVAGVFSAGMHEFDRGLAFLHLADAARLFKLGDTVTGVRLRMTEIYRAPVVVRDVAVELGGGYYVSDWTRSHANFFRSIRLTKTVMFVILLIVVAVAAFNIVSTLVMIVKDKQSDIAILRTLGAAPGSLLKVFVLQGAFIGVIGTLAGVLFGVLLAANIEMIVHGVERVVAMQFIDPSIYFISDLPAKIVVGDVVKIAATAILLSLLATIYPALKAARTQPAEALRHD